MEGIVYRYRAGVAWRDVPAEFGPWQTIWKRHRRYAGDGTWDTILAALLAHADANGLIDWTVSVDSTISRRGRCAGEWALRGWTDRPPLESPEPEQSTRKARWSIPSPPQLSYELRRVGWERVEDFTGPERDGLASFRAVSSIDPTRDGEIPSRFRDYGQV